MNNFKRNDLLFSLCGLNCGVCTMKLGGHCPGCGGGAGNQVCAIGKCSIQRGGMEYCHECAEYPCSKYDGITAFDSFITHRNQLRDMKKFQKIGMNSYHTELTEKSEILDELLTNYNDGRRKNFFSIAVNLLEIEDLRALVHNVKLETCSDSQSIKEKSVIAVNLFQALAKNHNIILKLNKKPKKR